jgi:hypothetical protein
MLQVPVGYPKKPAENGNAWEKPLVKGNLIERGYRCYER